MFYLVFRPQSTRVGERLRFNYRQQSFVGFTQNLEEALQLAFENLDKNYQIYETPQTLQFRMGDCTRYGFRRPYGVYVPYKRSSDGKEELIPNPLLSDEENAKNSDEIQKRRLEGVNRRLEELNQVKERLGGNNEETA